MTKAICFIGSFGAKEQAEAACELLRQSGIRVSTKPADLGRQDIEYERDVPEMFRVGEFPLCVFKRDAKKAGEVLHLAIKFVNEMNRGPLVLPPEEGTLENLDMLIHDCRQYLMIAAGELKDIDEEGELELDNPTNDIAAITIRLKRLKGQCMKMAGREPLDWEHGGGLGA